MTLTATASQVADENITVTLSTSGTATDGTDYSSVNSTTITISAGSTTGTKTFTPTDDSIYEGNESTTITISSIAGADATESGTQSITFTIIEDDSGPSITLSVSHSSVLEGDSTTVNITATATNLSSENITINLSTSGTATDGVDYTSLNGESITISAGSLAGTKSFISLSDSENETSETVIIDISSVSGGGAIENGTQQETITVFDTAEESIYLTPATNQVWEDSNGTYLYIQTRIGAATEDITVNIEVTGTANNGTDYYISGDSSTYIIPQGSFHNRIYVKDIDDEIYEIDETMIFNIVGVSGGNAVEEGDSSATWTLISGGSSPPSVSLSSSASTIDEDGGTITLTATASRPAYYDTIVTLSASGTATDGTDYSTLGGETITIPAESLTGTKSVSITNDSTHEGNETIVVDINSVSGDSTEFGTQSQTITIVDDESGPLISLSSNLSSVYDNGGNVTITATASETSSENIIVTLSTSGTATDGTDYTSLNGTSITINAGSSTGTSSFIPTEDTINEGYETAIISISSVSGGESGSEPLENGSQSITITINEYALRTGTAFTEGTTASQNAIKAETQWTNVDYSGSDSSVHPYEQMNIHKVQSFSDGSDNLTGKGQFIHIADFNCDDNHLIYSNKTIHNLDDGGVGESTFGAATSSDYHCQFVASMAAGDGTGNGDGANENALSGVAPDADLILSSIPNTSGTYASDDYADDLDSARGYGAVVSNNSWRVNDNTDGDANANWNITEAKDYISNNSLTNDQGLAYLLEGSTSSGAITATQEYITALNNFQNNGVIVFASGNYTGESDVSAVAALPELYPQLAEAWISVGMIDFTGSSVSSATESDFTLYGNKCGSAKEYCVVADGYQVNGGGYISGGSHYYPTNKSGSSFSAPMISGGIALLAQAFPNHNPEQLTDRLLASANNSWFTPEGNTTFTTHGNSITHGYHSTWGQGLPDFYAALSPITSNANPAMALYMGESIQESSNNDISVALASSSITPSASFGDSIYQGLSGEVGYAYDALSGGFKYDMTTRINMSNNDVQTINLTSELSKLDSPLSLANLSWKYNFSQVLSKLSETDKLKTSLTVGASSLPVQSFFGSNFDSSISLNDYETPYLESGEGGIGVGATYQLGNSRLLIGMTSPINQGNDNTIGLRKSLVTSMEYGNPSDTAVTVMVGITQDEDSLLGSTGNDAYGLSGAKSNTAFTAFKAQTQLGRGISLTGIATLANTNMTKPNDSFINSASSVKSTSVSLIANKRGLFGDDNMSFFVSQPNRVSDGRLSIRLSNLADSDGSLTYRNKDINLEPTARQLDYGLSYRKDYDNDISFSVKHMMTNNLNHKQDSQTVSSSFIGAKYKDLKVGFAKNPGEESRSAGISYSMQF